MGSMLLILFATLNPTAHISLFSISERCRASFMSSLKNRFVISLELWTGSTMADLYSPAGQLYS